MIDEEAAALMAATAVDGIRAMAAGQPVVAIVIVAPVELGIEVPFLRYRLHSNLGDADLRDVLERTIETIDRRRQQTVGQA
jgi:hypothetical protein